MGEMLDPHGIDAWEPWHPNELSVRLRTVEAPWHVAGGWALDLWHGFETRRHEDIEIAILRRDFSKFTRALPALLFFCVGGGDVQPLPSDADPPTSIHQVWCLDAQTRRWKLDIMLEPGTNAQWVFRRDGSVHRRRSDMIGRTGMGIPYLNPAGVLLFKAKHRRGKDELDFENVHGKLDGNEREWLRSALELAYPGHPWTSRL